MNKPHRFEIALTDQQKRGLADDMGTNSAAVARLSIAPAAPGPAMTLTPSWLNCAPIRERPIRAGKR
jgi:hypothetical protein